MSRVASLAPVSGCEIADVRYLDAIERVQLLLDDAERLFLSGQRGLGLDVLGQAVTALEALS